MLYGLDAPVTPAELTPAVCGEMAALFNQGLPAGSRINARSKMNLWRGVAGYATLFLGRDDNKKLVALGCMNTCWNLSELVARVEQVVIDEAARDESVEADILNRLVSWAAVVRQVDAVELDDRTCRMAPRVIGAAGFKRVGHLGPVADSHQWRFKVPFSAERK